MSSDWQTTENNRRARVYALTSEGRARLAEERAHWRRMSKAVEMVLGMADA